MLVQYDLSLVNLFCALGCLQREQQMQSEK